MQIPVCLYHGIPEERAELRRTFMTRVFLEQLRRALVSPQFRLARSL